MIIILSRCMDKFWVFFSTRPLVNEDLTTWICFLEFENFTLVSVAPTKLSNFWQFFMGLCVCACGWVLVYSLMPTFVGPPLILLSSNINNTLKIHPLFFDNFKLWIVILRSYEIASCPLFVCIHHFVQYEFL